MAPGGGDFERALDLILAFDFLEIDLVVAVGFEEGFTINHAGHERLQPREEVPGLVQESTP